MGQFDGRPPSPGWARENAPATTSPNLSAGAGEQGGTPPEETAGWVVSPPPSRVNADGPGIGRGDSSDSRLWSPASSCNAFRDQAS